MDSLDQSQAAKAEERGRALELATERLATERAKTAAETRGLEERLRAAVDALADRDAARAAGAAVVEKSAGATKASVVAFGGFGSDVEDATTTTTTTTTTTRARAKTPPRRAATATAAADVIESSRQDEDATSSSSPTAAKTPVLWKDVSPARMRSKKQSPRAAAEDAGPFAGEKDGLPPAGAFGVDVAKSRRALPFANRFSPTKTLEDALGGYKRIGEEVKRRLGETPAKTTKNAEEEVRSISHWFPYDHVGAVNADP